MLIVNELRITLNREHLSRVVDFYSRTHDNVLTIGDFNLEENSPTMRNMMNDSGVSGQAAQLH